MAASYQTISVVPTVELTGGGSTVDGSIYTARAIPSGATFSLFIGQVDLVPSHLELIVPTVAEAVNNAADVTGVDSLDIYQDVNNAGQFVTKLDVNVVSSSGNSFATIHPAYGTIFDDRFGKAVAASVANLDAIEGL